MRRMKLGIFIVAVSCLFASAAGAAGADRADAIERHRRAYELDSDPAHLVAIAHEHRRAGEAREALGYFCSYLYVDAAGPLADEASANARALSAQLGNPTQSDHDACSTRPPASRPAPVTTTVDTLAGVAATPPRISKREVAGLITFGGCLASLGLALVEARRLVEIRDDMRTNAPGTNLDALADRESSAGLRQKLFLGVGGAALITGGILYVTGRADRKRAERAMVAPTLTKGGGGLAVSGRF